MDASLIKMYASGNYSVSDFVRTIGAPASTIYDQMRRLRLPLLGQSGCKLRNYKSYGPRYNETIFSQEQVAMLAHYNAEGWSDSMIARELRLSPNPVRRLRKRLGLQFPRISLSVPMRLWRAEDCFQRRSQVG
jgi:hypothetical protein